MADEIQRLDAITEAVRSFFALARPGETLAVTVDPLDPRLRLSACGAPLMVSLAAGSRPFGRTVAMVHCSTPHPWSLYVPAKVPVPISVIVATHPLLRGQTISVSDIMLAERDSTDLPAGYLTDPNQIVGKVLTRPAAMGAVVSLSQALQPQPPPVLPVSIPIPVPAPRIVHRGEHVTLLVQGVGLTVRSAGVALVDASKGDRVSVRNENSQRIVEGTVEEAGIVVVDR